MARRSKTEIKLLKIRQATLDALAAYRAGFRVVPLERYRQLRVQLEMADELLRVCRSQALSKYFVDHS